MNRLEVRDLVVRYGRGSRSFVAVQNVSFSISAGRTLGLVGESGSGKSTIAKAIVGLLPVAGGRIVLEGTDVSVRSARTAGALRRRAQIVFQDPFSSLNPRLTAYEQIKDALIGNPDVSRGAWRAEAARLMTLVGLDTAGLDRYPHQFSGGQRQRIAIARALAVQPQLLILDEVTSALDVSVQATVLNLLRDLQSQLGLSYLFISHDLSVVRSMSDTITVLHLAEAVESADTDALFATPQHPYTCSLIASIPQLSASPTSQLLLSGDLPDPHHPPTGCRFRTRCPIGPAYQPERNVCASESPQETPVSASHWARCHFINGTELRA